MYPKKLKNQIDGSWEKENTRYYAKLTFFLDEMGSSWKLRLQILTISLSLFLTLRIKNIWFQLIQNFHQTIQRERKISHSSHPPPLIPDAPSSWRLYQRQVWPAAHKSPSDHRKHSNAAVSFGSDSSWVAPHKWHIKTTAKWKRLSKCSW